MSKEQNPESKDSFTRKAVRVGAGILALAIGFDILVN